MFASRGLRARRELNGRKVEAAQDLAQPDAGDAAVEVGERVKEEQAAFGEGERFEQWFGGIAAAGGEASLQVAAVLAGERGDLEEARRLVLAGGDVGAAPAREPRHEVAADERMELQEQRVVERGLLEFAVFDALFEREDVARKMRRELSVTQDPEARFDVAGSAARGASSTSTALAFRSIRRRRFASRRELASLTHLLKPARHVRQSFRRLQPLAQGQRERMAKLRAAAAFPGAQAPVCFTSRLVHLGPASSRPKAIPAKMPPMRPSEILSLHRDKVLAIAASRGASNVRVFGSAARRADREGSDLDLLVDVPAGSSLLDIAGLQIDIEEALGIKVDLCTEAELHPSLKERILAEARPL